MRILIVDDDPGTADLLEISVSLWDHSASKAVNANEAIELLKQETYDVIITDAEMPAMSGFELCRYVRPRFPHMFIIGITGSLDFHKFREAGADRFFKKPFQLDDLHAVLKNIQPALESGTRLSEAGCADC